MDGAAGLLLTRFSWSVKFPMIWQFGLEGSADMHLAGRFVGDCVSKTAVEYLQNDGREGRPAGAGRE